MARKTHAFQQPFHVDLGIVAEHGRAVLLTTAVEQYVVCRNAHSKPFIWTATARDIAQEVIRATAG
jgi:hypothetical protein